MQLNENQLQLIANLCDYAESVGTGKDFDPITAAVKELRNLVRQNTWYGPFDNPFKAYINCANANNLDTSEVLQFVLPGWLCDWEMGGDGDRLLDDLLQELAGYTGIVVQYCQRPDLFSGSSWYARLDKEVE